MWNKHIYKTTYWFSLKETIASFVEDEYLTDAQLKSILSTIGLYTESPVSNPLGLEFISDFALSTKVINRILERYSDHYLFEGEKENIEDETIARNSAVKKIFRVLDLTFPKYSKILSLYESKKNNLLDAIGRTETETHTSQQNENHADIDGMDTITKFNDTPQASGTGEDPFADDTHVSELTKGKTTSSKNGNSQVSGSASINRTHGDDGTTIMNRLDEISNKYEKTMLKWLNEFDTLFIEEGNV